MIALLLFAGHETTTTLLTSGLIELLRHRSEWERLCDDPELVPPAVEEVFRYASPAQWGNRVPRTEIDWDGYRIPEEQTIIVSIAAANRDPRAFDEPDRLAVTRPPRSNHLGLGFGKHYCLGASLLRREVQLAWGELVRRYPKLELAIGFDELEWSGNPILRSVRELPIRLGPRVA
jgi:cytochrome P450